MAPHLDWAKPFQQPHRERQFQREKAAVRWRQDQLTGILVTLLSCAFAIRYWNAFPPRLKAKELGLSTIFLAPWAWWAWRGAEGSGSYFRLRLWSVSVMRIVGTVVLVHIWDHPHFLAPLGVAESPMGAFGAFIFATNLSDLLFYAHGFRLPFYLHCAVQAASLIPTLRALPNSCTIDYVQQPLLQQFYREAASRLSQVAGAVSPAGALALAGLGPWPNERRSGSASSAAPSAEMAEMDPHCSCVTVLATCDVLLGYLLPSLLVATGERAARARFVERRLAEGGWSVEEQRYHLLYDELSVWLRVSLLLPLIIAWVWHAVVAVAARAGAC